MITTPRRHRSRRARTLIALTLAASLVAACGGGGDDSADTTTSTVADTTTTEESTTTTAAPTTTAAEVTTTTEAPADPVMPLTGLPITDEAIAARPAMAVKIDNHGQARPQAGLNNADIVFEENVERLTRFAAVFHSQDANPVGPVRSGRTQDVDLLGSFAEPLFVWSGGNPSVTRAINDSDLVSLSPSTTRNVGFFRSGDESKDYEHTLFARTPDLWLAFTRIFAPPPPQQFTYRGDDEAFNGEPSTGVDVAMDGVRVNWTWDAASVSYLRSQAGRPHLVAEGGQVNAANVVVLEVDYRPSPADARSPEAQTIGSGTAYVYTGGVLIRGTWSRTDRLAPFVLTDESGAEIGLTPGRTWVELARIGTVTPL